MTNTLPTPTPHAPIIPGDRVNFAPNCPSLKWAAGERTVKGFENGMVRLGCGDVKLLARVDELTLIFRKV